MSCAEIHFYYKNVCAEVIGAEHGINRQQFDQLAAQTAPLIQQLNQQRKEGKTRYRDLPYRQDYAQQCKAVAARIAKNCENFVVLGIGGSALGNIALQTALNPYMYNLDEKQRQGKPRLFVFDNVDPHQFGSFLQWVEDKLDRTIFNIISKSGRTAETAAQMLVIFQMIEKRLGKQALKKQLIATTDPKEGTLRKLADCFGLETLEVPEGVGGRFSVLSPVGLLSAAVCGIDIDQLLAGAAAMDKRCSVEQFYQNPAALNAAINWHYYQRGKPISVMMPYSHSLKDMSDWYRQLWAESLGKAYDLQGHRVCVGPTPVNALGTTDQHSQVQLYREGPNDKLFTFLQVQSFSRDVLIGPSPAEAPELDYLAGKPMSRLMNAEKAATEYALLQDQRPCLTIYFDAITPFTVGQFIYLFEVTTSLAGLLFNINAYDQPAVELGKDATFALMDKAGTEAMAAKIRPFVQIDKAYWV